MKVVAMGQINKGLLILLFFNLPGKHSLYPIEQITSDVTLETHRER